MSAAAATAATTTAYSNYLIPARGYPYYYFKLGVDKSNKSKNNVARLFRFSSSFQYRLLFILINNNK